MTLMGHLAEQLILGVGAAFALAVALWLGFGVMARYRQWQWWPYFLLICLSLCLLGLVLRDNLSI